MPGAVWARERVKTRWLQHTYTRVPRAQQQQPANGPAFQDQDEWGGPIALQDTDPGAPAATPNLPCHFMDRGQEIITAEGPVQIDTPTLMVAYDDPLTVGDLVRDIVAPATGETLLTSAFVDTVSFHTPAGPVMWKLWQLRNTEVV